MLSHVQAEELTPYHSDLPPSLAEVVDLVVRSGLGDQQAFASFYAFVFDDVVTLLRRSEPESRIDDVTVDVFVALWRHSREFDPEDVDLWSWIARRALVVVRNADRRR